MGWYACDRCGWMSKTSDLPFVCSSREEGCRDMVKETWFSKVPEHATRYARRAGLVVRGAVAFRGVWSEVTLGQQGVRTLEHRFHPRIYVPNEDDWQQRMKAWWWRTKASLGSGKWAHCDMCEQRTGTRCCPHCWATAKATLVEVDAENPSIIGVVGFTGSGKTNLIHAMLHSLRSEYTVVGSSVVADRDYESMFGSAARRPGSTVVLPQQTTEMPAPWTIRNSGRRHVGVIFDTPGEQVQAYASRTRNQSERLEQDELLEQALMRMNRLMVVLPFEADEAQLSEVAAAVAFLGAKRRADTQVPFDRVAICVTMLDRCLDAERLRDSGQRLQAAVEFIRGHAKTTYLEAVNASTGQATEAKAFGVSALGKAPRETNKVDAPLEPLGVDEPLRWLIDADARGYGALVEE